MLNQDEEITRLKKVLEWKDARIDQLVQKESEMKKTIRLKDQEVKNATDTLRATKERFKFREGLSVLYHYSLEDALDIKTREVETLKNKVDEMNVVFIQALKIFSDMEADRILSGCGHRICMRCSMDIVSPNGVKCRICKTITRFDEKSVQDGLKNNSVLETSHCTL